MAAYRKRICFSQQYPRNGLADLNQFSSEQIHLSRQAALTQAFPQPNITTAEVFRSEQRAAQRLNGSAGRLQSYRADPGPLFKEGSHLPDTCVWVSSSLLSQSFTQVNSEEASLYFAFDVQCHRLNMLALQNLLR